MASLSDSSEMLAAVPGDAPPPRKRQKLHNGTDIDNEHMQSGGAEELAVVPQSDVDGRAIVPQHLPYSRRDKSTKRLERVGGCKEMAEKGRSLEQAGDEPQIDSGEVIRLMLQALGDLGLHSTARCLQRESGIAFETASVRRFRSALLRGDWAVVSECLSGNKVLCCTSQTNEQKVAFLITRQRYLEHLEAGETAEAVALLRLLSRLCLSLGKDDACGSGLQGIGGTHRPLLRPAAEARDYVKELRHLSSLVSCTSPESVREQANWSGAHGSAREDLLYMLHDYVPASVLIPEHRLSTLLRQAVQQQEHTCPVHAAVASSVHLLADHHCSTSPLPRDAKMVLTEHDDEVWFLEFSHSGETLVSASQDSSVIAWDMREGHLGQVRWRLRDAGAVTFLAWSPDDKYLLAAGGSTIALVDPVRGRVLKEYPTAPVEAVAWCSNSTTFVYGGRDKCIRKVDLQGEELATWEATFVIDMAVSADGTLLVAACQDRRVVVINLVTGAMDSFAESHSLTACALTRDKTCVALHLVNQEIHLWNLATKRLEQKYVHAANVEPLYYVVRPAFGGPLESFLLCGSQGGNINVWHKERGQLIEVIQGHDKMVNCIAWSPLVPNMFASASDDNTVRLWLTAM